jgi:hypothetical protein
MGLLISRIMGKFRREARIVVSTPRAPAPSDSGLCTDSAAPQQQCAALTSTPLLLLFPLLA